MALQMMTAVVLLNLVTFFLAAFFIGSIPFGYIISRVRGVDIRLHGSGNVGATNVGRTLGKKAGLVTLVLDAIKGASGSALGYYCPNPPLSPEFFVPLTGICAMYGHCYSPFLRFNGGKGVAAGMGAFFVIAPLATAISIPVFLIAIKLSRYVSIASISAALSLPVSIALLSSQSPPPTALAASLLAVCLVIARHGGNIARISKGIETKFGDSVDSSH
jgi:glycerol-3-phosphate acyltransferase PlsY